jgi:7-keto-8-aminopelargonate synthetase-like enzyme
MSSKRDELIAKYATDIKEKFGETPDMDLLTKVTIGLGPAIYNLDASKVSGVDEKELETVKNNYLVKKLGLADGPQLMDAVKTVVDKYGSSVKSKYRAVVYYMLCKHFDKASAYN